LEALFSGRYAKLGSPKLESSFLTCVLYNGAKWKYSLTKQCIGIYHRISYASEFAIPKRPKGLPPQRQFRAVDGGHAPLHADIEIQDNNSDKPTYPTYHHSFTLGIPRFIKHGMIFEDSGVWVRETSNSVLLT